MLQAPGRGGRKSMACAGALFTKSMSGSTADSKRSMRESFSVLSMVSSPGRSIACALQMSRTMDKLARPKRGSRSLPLLTMPQGEMSLGEADSAGAEESAMPLASVLRVSGGLRAIFGSPGYKPPILPSVALEIHDLSCRPDIDTEKLVALLERDPMLAAHVLRVANSPIFRGRDAETS